jgi:hypothetical protein
MDKRSEPRFHIRSAVKIAAIDHPEQVSEALLLDVSGAGLKMVSDSWWPVETRIVIEMENHIVVARVRNIVARGPKFSLGAERLYSILKHTLPSGASRTVWHNLLRAEMREQPPAPAPAAPRVDPFEMAPPEIAPPAALTSTLLSSPIGEPEGVARKITIRTSAPPEAIEIRSEPQAVPQVFAPFPASEPARISSVVVVEEPAIAQPVVPNTGKPFVEPQVAGAIPQARPFDSVKPEARNPVLVEAWPPEPHPQALPILREPVSLVLAEPTAPSGQRVAPLPSTPEEVVRVVPPSIPKSQVDAPAASSPSVGPQTIQNTVVRRPALPETASPQIATKTPRRQNGALRPPRGTMADNASSDPAINSKATGDPPLARAFPLLPQAAPAQGTVASPPLAPQFGPAYGMAPTADGLVPISIMPEIVPEVAAKTRWVMSSAVAAGVLGMVVLAFYYGPFRPKGSSAPRPEIKQHAAVPLTIPAVTEGPSPVGSTTDAPPNRSDTAVSAVSTTPAPASKPPSPPAPAVAAQTRTSPVALTAKSASPAAAPTQAGQAQTGIHPAPTQTAKVNPPPTPGAPAIPSSGSTAVRHVTVKASSMLWFSACSDGKPAFAKVLQAGESMDIDFQQLTVFRLGNSGAARMTFDGKQLAPLGAPGAVKIVELSAAGLRELPPNIPAGAECQPTRASAKP